MADDEAIELHRKIVIELSKPGQALSANTAHETVRNPDWFTELGPTTWEPKAARRQLHKSLIVEQQEKNPNALNNREAIVLAGPPGAGKSTVLKSILGEERDQYLVIDADKFKVALLRQAQQDGSYETKIKPPEIRDREEAGEKFFPLELASLVHEESSMLAGRLRAEAIREGTNIVVDTVLSSEGSAQELGRQLNAAGYSVQIIDVEVPFEISEGRIAKRWQKDYEAALDGQDELGGRWVPSEYARAVFDGPEGKSKPEAVAQKLAAECPAVERYRLYRTTQEGTESAPAVGTWEKDLMRQKRGGPLLDTAQVETAKRAALSRPSVQRLNPQQDRGSGRG